ncbi:MAG: TIGR04551 family protein [Polyangiales bacterium]|nr:TIGR04551 family protein [Sandaracinus sp.]
MRLLLRTLLLLSLAAPALAQPATTPAEEDDLDAEPVEGEETDEEGEEGEDGEEPTLRPPSLEMPSVSEDEWDEAEANDANEDSQLLQQAEPPPPSGNPTEVDWRAPTTNFTLNGYFRVRGELWDSLYLGRDDAPFNLFRPAARDTIPAGSCRGSATPEADDDLACKGDRLRFANTRLRLQPTLALSEDVRVRMTLDVFDNMVLGSTPDGYAYRYEEGTGFVRADRVPGVPLDSFTTGQNPPQDYRNSLRDSIYVRHAWAEVTNRGLGQLRFGRMPSHWGLGLIAHDGNGIDSDFSSDADRIMGLTRIAGMYVVAAYDFASKGVLRQFSPYDVRGLSYDASPQDDIRQFVFAIARRTDPEEARDRLQRGSWVLDGGLYFVYRHQFLSSAGVTNAFPVSADYSFVRRDARAFIPDLWARFQMRGVRLELEASYIGGRVRNIQNDSYRQDDLKIRQFGFAFEGEYRLLSDKLSIRLYAGYASGDPDIEGLSDRQGILAQTGSGSGSNTVSHFQFHPNYRIDQILWRNVMGRVAGAYYLRPGVSYDIIRSPFGQLFGLGVDAVYSRASQEVQTYGSDPNLGLELDLSLYYRSEDGPETFDGFYAQFHYAVLFPFDGLGDPAGALDPVDLKNAQILRLILGVQF